MSNLKPCPFCGKPPYERRAKYNPYARCKTEGCKGGQLPIIKLDDQNDIEAWNTRAESTELTTLRQQNAELLATLELACDLLLIHGWSDNYKNETKDIFRSLEKIKGA
jgi:hypothetical protein